MSLTLVNGKMQICNRNTPIDIILKLLLNKLHSFNWVAFVANRISACGEWMHYSYYLGLL